LNVPINGVSKITVSQKGKDYEEMIVEKKIDFEVKKNAYKKTLTKGELSLCDF